LKLNLLVLGCALLGLGLSACSTSPNDQDETKNWSAEKLHREGKSALEATDYEEAIELFETLEARFPFGQYAEQAQLDTAYAYYKFEEPDSAISAADRFIKLHPRHAQVDYAYYLRGLASASKKDNALDSILPQDSSLRDPASTQKAHDYFAECGGKFPADTCLKTGLNNSGGLLYKNGDACTRKRCAAYPTTQPNHRLQLSICKAKL